jgi:DNA-binding response OmpR family regulator
VLSSVLILEDDQLVGRMLSELLREAGYQVVGPADSVESALALVAEHGINAALLDIDLGAEGLCFGLATMLQAQRIPFAFLTGYPALLTPIELRSSPRIEKPFSHDEVLTIVRNLVGAGPSTGRNHSP